MFSRTSQKLSILFIEKWVKRKNLACVKSRSQRKGIISGGIIIFRGNWPTKKTAFSQKILNIPKLIWKLLLQLEKLQEKKELFEFLEKSWLLAMER